MRIALKLTLALVAVIVALLAAEASLRGLREAAVYEQDIRREQRVLGRALEGSAELVWSEAGLDRAADLLTRASDRQHEVAVRLAEEDEALDHAKDPEARQLWATDGAIQVSEPGMLRTFLRLDGPDGARRAIELSTSLRGEGAHVRDALTDFAWIALALLLAASIAALWLGRRLVGHRVDRLVTRARAIGRGDFREVPIAGGHDELSQLEGALEEMAGALAGTRRALDEETQARLAATTHLRRSDRLATVGTLAAGLAHELGTPLHVINGRARLLTRTAQSSAEVRANADAIIDQATRVTRIIEQLLDFARPRAPVRRPFDVDELLRGDIELIAPLFRNPSVRTTILRPERASKPPHLFGDPDQIRQVFTNLLLNAGQAMPKGGLITIELSSNLAAPPELVSVSPEAATQRFTRIAFRDEGEGIDREALPRLFDPFFTTKEIGEGSGLGLAVAHGIISDHGGWIVAESGPGRGSTFLVWLPEVFHRDDTVTAADREPQPQSAERHG